MTDNDVAPTTTIEEMLTAVEIAHQHIAVARPAMAHAMHQKSWEAATEYAKAIIQLYEGITHDLKTLLEIALRQATEKAD